MCQTKAKEQNQRKRTIKIERCFLLRCHVDVFNLENKIIFLIKIHIHPYTYVNIIIYDDYSMLLCEPLALNLCRRKKKRWSDSVYANLSAYTTYVGYSCVFEVLVRMCCADDIIFVFNETENIFLCWNLIRKWFKFWI